MHIIRSESLSETFWREKSRQQFRQESRWESRIGLYAGLPARISPRLVFFYAESVQEKSESDSKSDGKQRPIFWCHKQIEKVVTSWERILSTFVYLINGCVYVFISITSAVLRRNLFVLYPGEFLEPVVRHVEMNWRPFTARDVFVVWRRNEEIKGVSWK